MIVNSIVQFNLSSNNITGGTVSYSCMSPLVVGTGNTTNAPLFVNASAGNYRLSVGSPCIDKGTNVAWMLGATDLDGNARIVNGTVDMGAYETGFSIGIRFSAIDVTWNSAPGITYQVQSSTNLLSPASWTNVGTSVTATGTSAYVYDWIRDYNGKFYRILQLP